MATRKRRVFCAGTILAIALTAGPASASTATFNPSADGFINSRLGANNNGGSNALFTGREGLGGVMRALLRFDLSALTGHALVQSVTLTLRTVGIGSTETGNLIAATVSLRPLAASEFWGEGTAVGNASSSFVVGGACAAGEASWNAPQCNAGAWNGLAGASASQSVGVTPGVNVVLGSTGSMVNDVQGWINSPTGSGWVLTSSTECVLNTATPPACTNGQIQKFSSRQGGVAPVLSVTYTTCTAARNSNCVTTQGNTCNDANSFFGSSYTCSCFGGYTSSTDGGGNPICADRNDCAADKVGTTNPCQDGNDSGASCMDRVAPQSGRHCTCTAGFNATNNDTTSANCVANCPPQVGQSDPCSAGGTIAGSCTPGAPGNWSCTCPTGWVPSSGMQQQCIPFDACSDTAHGAVGNSKCLNGIDGNKCTDVSGGTLAWDCTCTTGYTDTGGTAPTCVDTDECATNHCIDGGDAQAKCGDHKAPATGYDCTCSSPLFELGMVAGKLSCVDKNECASPSPFPCLHGDCSNIDAAGGSGYSCGCQAGFVSTGGKTPTCVHPDSCSGPSTASACQTDKSGNGCTDNPPPEIGYRCQCGNPAYTASVDGRSCIDRDACLGAPCADDGDENATCTDHKAPKSGYDCDCSPGFAFDGTTCVDVNECANGSNPCAHGSCNNTKGSYSCTCALGYQLKSGSGAPTCVQSGGLSNVTYQVIPGSGCGCDVGGRAPISGAPALLLFAAMWVFLRRSRKPNG